MSAMITLADRLRSVLVGHVVGTLVGTCRGCCAQATLSPIRVRSTENRRQFSVGGVGGHQAETVLRHTQSILSQCLLLLHAGVVDKRSDFSELDTCSTTSGGIAVW
jgi:hypothetical protein